MYVQGRWADNAFTVQGRNVHRRTDKLDHVLPDAVGGDNSAGKTEQAAAASDGAEAGDGAGDERPNGD
ncbi:MAG: hypothetical protein KGY81_08580, partial [Phycisphaerae bacterium]|nr:hypothetical protein [Phycisphaerae bacterium]